MIGADLLAYFEKVSTDGFPPGKYGDFLKVTRCVVAMMLGAHGEGEPVISKIRYVREHLRRGE